MTDQNLPGTASAGENDQTATDAATSAPPRRTRSRRAAGAPATTPVPSDEAAAPAQDAPDAAPAAKTSTPRKRSPRKAAAPVTEAPAGVESPAEPPKETGAGAEGAPARPRRTRRSGATSAPTAAAAPDEPDEATRPDATELEPAESAGAVVQVGGAPRLAATALLFQAPDPTTRPRRRRAEAPAGPPRHPDQDLRFGAAVENRPVEDLADEELTEDKTTTDDVVDAPVPEDEHDEGAARRRRRRGGRGRRGRSGGEHGEDREDRAEQTDTDEAKTPGEDAPQAEAPKGRGSRRTAGAAAGSTAGRKRGGRQAAAPTEGDATTGADVEADEPEDTDGSEGEGTSSSSRRRRRRRRSRGEGGEEPAQAEPRARTKARSDEVTALKGSTRLEAKRQRRREGRDAGRRRTIITEAEFLTRREAVERSMVVRESDGRVQIGIVEDGVLVEHYVSRSAQNSGAPMAGNVYLGRVQNVLPSMEAAFVDIGKGRNAVLYAGEVNWDAAGLEGQPRRIEQALKSGDPVLVQVTKEPIGHKGARLTSQVTLAGRYLVYVPGGGMTGISRKLADTERARLKKILKEIVPDDAGVIVRTAAEGASDEELRRDVQRLQDQWTVIEKKSRTASAPALLQGEPDLAIRVVRDIFNDDFASLVVQGDEAWSTVSEYVAAMAPDLADKVSRWTGKGDVFAANRLDEQLAKGMDRKVYLPSGGSLVIDRTEAMTVVDVNTGKFTGSGGTLEETVTRNNLEAAEEIVRQLRLRDIGGIIVIDFIDMVLESNRDLVLRRLIECLGRDRTKHQVAEVTSLGLVQMTRKRVGQGLLEAFSEPCADCNGRGFIIHSEPVDSGSSVEPDAKPAGEPDTKRPRRKKAGTASPSAPAVPVLPEAREAVKATLATIAAAAAHAHEHKDEDAAREGAEPAQETAPDEAAGVPEAAETELADAIESVEAVEATEAAASPTEEPHEV